MYGSDLSAIFLGGISGQFYALKIARFEDIKVLPIYSCC